MTSSTPEPAATPSQERTTTLLRLVALLLALAFYASPLLLPQGGAATGRDPVVGAELAGDGLKLALNHEVLVGIARGEEGLGATLTAPWWGQMHDGQALWRPVPLFLLGVASGLAGEPYDPEDPGSTPLPFHILVLGLHVLVTVLLFELALELTRSDKVAFVAAAIFATMPVHTEVLFDVAGMAELSAAAFGLAAWLLWLQAGDKPLAKPGLFAGSLACLALAGLSKESAFVLPLVFLLVDAGRGGGRLDLGGALKKAPALGAMVAVLALLLVVRTTVLGGLVPEYTVANHLDNPLLAVGPLDRIGNGFRMMACAVLVMVGINPLRGEGGFGDLFGFSADYSAAQVTALGAFSPWNLLAIVAVLGSAVLAVVLAKRCSMRAGLWLAMLASLLLVSNVLLPIGTVFGERLLYLPSALLVLVVAMTLVRFGKAGVAVGLLVAIGGGVWTMDRAQAWETPLELIRTTEKHDAPRSAKAKFAAALDLRQEELYGFAIDKFEQAIALFPDYAVAESNLGVTLEADLRHEEALPHYLRAIEIQVAARDGAYVPEPYGTPLGQVELLTRLTQLRVYTLDDAQAHLDWLDGLIQGGYESPHAHYVRGRTLLTLGRVPEGEAAYRRSIELEPTAVGVAYLGELLRKSGRHEEGLALYAEHANHTEWLPGEQAELLLRRADAELAFDVDQALATLDAIDALDATLSAEQLFRLKWTFAQAKLESLPADPDGRATALGLIEAALKSAFADYNVATDTTHAARYALVDVFRMTGKDDELVATAEELLSYRSMPLMRTWLAAAYGRKGELDKAVDNWRGAADELLAEDGTAVDLQGLLTARRGLVQALYAADRDNEVPGLFAVWHQLGGGRDAWTLGLEADHRAGRGDLDQAIALTEELVRDFPEATEAAGLLVQLQAWKAGDDMAASAGYATHLIGWENYEAALPVAERALSQAADDMTKAQALGLVANCLILMGRQDDALARLDEALALQLPQAFLDQIRATREQVAGG